MIRRKCPQKIAMDLLSLFAVFLQIFCAYLLISYRSHVSICCFLADRLSSQIICPHLLFSPRSLVLGLLIHHVKKQDNRKRNKPWGPGATNRHELGRRSTCSTKCVYNTDTITKTSSGSQPQGTDLHHWSDSIQCTDYIANVCIFPCSWISYFLITRNYHQIWCPS